MSDWGHDFRPDYRRLRALIAELPPGHPGAGHHGDGERPRGPRRHRAAGARPRESRWCCAARWTARACGCRSCGCRRPRSGSGGSPRTWRSCPAPGSCTRSRRRRGGGRGVPARARVPGRVLHRQDRSGAAAGRGGGPAGEPGQGAGRHQRAGHGVRQAGPRLRRAPRRAVLARRLLPADRPGRARGASGRRWCSCRAPRTATSGPTSPRSPSRPSRSCAARWRCCRIAPLSTAAIETRVDLSRTRLEMLLKVLDSDGAVQRVKGGWVATGQPWVYDAERHRRIATAREAEQAAMLAYLDTSECRLVYLRRQLDDDTAQPCGRCDTCTGTVWSPSVDADTEAAAQERISRPGVAVPPRKQWPSGMAELGVPASGRIPAGELADEGRVIGRLSDIGWGTRLRELVSGRRRAGPAGRARRLRHGAGRLVVGGAAGGRGRASGRGRGRTSSRTWPGGSPRSAACRCSAPRRRSGPRPAAVGELRAAAGGGVGRVHRARPRRSRRAGAAGRRRGRQRLDGHGASPACCAGPVPRPCCPSRWRWTGMMPADLVMKALNAVHRA